MGKSLISIVIFSHGPRVTAFKAPTLIRAKVGWKPLLQHLQQIGNSLKLKSWAMRDCKSAEKRNYERLDRGLHTSSGTIKKEESFIWLRL